MEYTETRHFEISGLNATKNEDGTITGVTINNKEVTVSSDLVESNTTPTINGKGYSFRIDNRNISVASADTTIENQSAAVTIFGNSTTTIKNKAVSSMSVNGGVVENEAAAVTIFGGGTTTLTNTYNGASITGGNFRSSISNAYLEYSESLTVIGGENSSYKSGNGDNYISVSGSNNYYIYGEKTGNDVLKRVFGLNNNTLIVDGLVKDFPLGVSSVTYSDGTLTFAYSSPNPEIYVATSGNETVTVGTDAKYQKAGSTVKTIKPKKKNAAMSGVNAGAGDDTVVVTSAAEGFSILGGHGNDSIDIQGHGTNGNYYVYTYGDGKDTIKGWDSDKDTLVVDDANYQTSMSADGRTFSIVVGSGSVSFEGLAYGQKVKVSVSGSSAAASECEVTRLMEGTSRTETINNLSTEANFNTGSGTEQFTLDAKEGNDVIYNAGSHVSINAGEGNDSIYIQQNESDTSVTSNVSIRGGWGNDLIDVSGDYTLSADDIPVTTYGGHVYEFGADDGRDSIVGFNSNDTITLIDVSSDSISADVDVNGNYVIQAEYTTIIIKKPEGKELGGTTLNVKVKSGTGVPVNATAAIYEKLGATEITSGVYTIPKKILLDNSGNTRTYDADYDNYTVDASGGMDVLTVSGKAISLNAGASNDTITLTGGTNVDAAATDTNVALVSANIVTVQGGYGNDYIDARNDKAHISDEDATEIRASHIYEINRDSGRDTIMGFNPNDTIKFTDVTASTIDSSEISADFDDTGNYYVLTFGSSSVYLDISNDYFKGNKKLNIVNNTGTVIELTGANSDTVLTKVSLDASGEETTVPSSYSYVDDGSGAPDLTTKKAHSWYYIVPKKLMGTRGSDTEEKLTNIDDDFVVEALAGNDVVVNKGASKVYIDGGAGNDTIWLTKSTVVAETTDGATVAVDVYGEDISIYGGAGNDIIYDDAAEVVTLASSAEVDDDAQFGHAYIFGAYDGNDSIYFFGTRDSIYIAEGAELVNSSVSGDNLIINVGPKGEARKTASITLVDYIKTEGVDTSFKLAQWDSDNSVYVAQEMYPPRVNNGTTGNDTITNSGNNVSIYGGAGNDSIINSGTNTTYIFGGNIAEGNDTITGFNQATDLIYVETAGATIDFVLNVSNNLVATINYNGTTYASVILNGVSSGSVRYKIADGAIQTYTIT